MPKKNLKKLEWWEELIGEIPPIEELDTQGANRHRRECWKTSLKLKKKEPKTAEEFEAFMMEYIRQLVGPEIFDQYNDMSDKNNISVVFRIVRKYTLGE